MFVFHCPWCALAHERFLSKGATAPGLLYSPGSEVEGEFPVGPGCVSQRPGACRCLTANPLSLGGTGKRRAPPEEPHVYGPEIECCSGTNKNPEGSACVPLPSGIVTKEEEGRTPAVCREVKRVTPLTSVFPLKGAILLSFFVALLLTSSILPIKGKESETASRIERPHTAPDDHLRTRPHGRVSDSRCW